MQEIQVNGAMTVSSVTSRIQRCILQKIYEVIGNPRDYFLLAYIKPTSILLLIAALLNISNGFVKLT